VIIPESLKTNNLISNEYQLHTENCEAMLYCLGIDIQRYYYQLFTLPVSGARYLNT